MVSELAAGQWGWFQGSGAGWAGALAVPAVLLMLALGCSLRRISWRGGGRWSGC